MESICIYGGGNIAHSLVAAIAVTQPVTVITRHPESWASRMVFEQDGQRYDGAYNVYATSDVTVVRQADTVFIALPQYAIKEAISRILLYLKYDATLVFVPAPAKSIEYAKLLIAKGVRVVGFQRVPFISRIIQYGHLVRITLPRQVHKLVVSDDIMKDEWTFSCKKLFGGKAEYLSSFMTFAFSNSNPLLHPSRLVVLLQKASYDKIPLFYEDWTDESSRYYVASDKEMLAIMRCCEEVNIATDYESVMQHYEVTTIYDLTKKIRSIPGFRGIFAPYKEDSCGKYIPDLESRYFTEDVAYGTNIIQKLGREHGILTPVIDMFVDTINDLFL